MTEGNVIPVVPQDNIVFNAWVEQDQGKYSVLSYELLPSGMAKVRA
jgi:hypothetical protein